MSPFLTEFIICEEIWQKKCAMCVEYDEIPLISISVPLDLECLFLVTVEVTHSMEFLYIYISCNTNDLVSLHWFYAKVTVRFYLVDKMNGC